jgi:hypothetical protein
MKIADDLSLALDPSLLMVEAGLTPDPWQQQVLRSQAKRQLLLTSRQSGKSTVSAVLALHQAVYQPKSLVLILSPSLRQSQELFRKVQDVYRSLPNRPGFDLENTLRLELSNGSRIVALPGREETVRGFSGVSLLIVDEATRVPDPLYYSIRPMLAVSNGRLICMSTPYGQRGFFFEEWEKGPNWERTKITAHDCLRISGEFLVEERQALGEHWFRQEYLCEFVETEDQLFGHDLIQSALSDEVRPLFEDLTA